MSVASDVQSRTRHGRIYARAAASSPKAEIAGTPNGLFGWCAGASVANPYADGAGLEMPY